MIGAAIACIVGSALFGFDDRGQILAWIGLFILIAWSVEKALKLIA